MTPFRCAVLGLIICVALALPSVAPAERPKAGAPEATASACPTTIRLGDRRFAYWQKGRVNCTRARRAVRRLHATYGREGRPRGFRCRSITRFRKHGSCKATSTRYFGFSR